MTNETKDPVEGAVPAGPEVEGGPEDEGRLHPLQKLLDNPWLLLALGFVVPFLSYTVWGWVELLLTKPAELP
ncbi:MAG: hypothetical protein KDB32_02890 [Planctomycetes bacterium]|nr:hypothetical protein [Planctomycetota bacterium]